MNSKYQNRLHMHVITNTIALAVGLAMTQSAHAFSEDLCPSRQGGWSSCIQRTCNPQGENTACEAATAMSQYITLAAGDPTGIRSVLHFDSLYLLAQAAGLSPKDAFQMASYNQAVDTGKYDHRDDQGQLMLDRASCGDPAQASAQCMINSADIGGVGRNNFVGGGIFFHFHTVPPVTRTKNGLNPEVTDPTAEPFLNHLRTWAHGRGPLCLGGLSFVGKQNQIDSGKACYQSTTRPETTLLGKIPFVTELGEYAQLDWISTIEEQRVVRNSQTGELSFASELEKNLPKGVPADMVRMGIYLHALQDRISHHRCITASKIEGPRPADAPPILTNTGVKTLYDLAIFRDPINLIRNALAYPVASNPEFYVEFSRMECDQFSHFQRHSFEVGVPQNTLDDRDKTTEAGLRKAFTEIALFVKEFRKLPTAVPPGKAEAFIADLIKAIEEPNPTLRIQRISEVAPKYNLLPLPGHLGIDLQTWLSQAEGKKTTGGDRTNINETSNTDQAPSSTPSASGGGGGFDALGLLGLTLLMLLWQSARNHALRQR
ncbi:MAG TPA: hypothetical protein VFV57_11530 [Limnobacter sp.]|nr:hypothetical protein [Limnobacter sp.]